MRTMPRPARSAVADAVAELEPSAGAGAAVRRPAAPRRGRATGKAAARGPSASRRQPETPSSAVPTSRGVRPAARRSRARSPAKSHVGSRLARISPEPRGKHGAKQPSPSATASRCRPGPSASPRRNTQALPTTCRRSCAIRCGARPRWRASSAGPTLSPRGDPAWSRACATTRRRAARSGGRGLPPRACRQAR